MTDSLIIEKQFKPASRTNFSRLLVMLRNDRLTTVAALLLLLIVLSAVFAPFIATYDPYQGSVLRRLAPVGTPGHFLGTDEAGRDLWSRLIYGGRLSLLVALIPVALALVIGMCLGVVAGYARGVVNTLIMRTTDVFYAFPPVLLAVAIAGVLGPGFRNIIIALTASFIPPIVRLSESVTAQIRHFDFVEAARTSGASTSMILRRHVLVNVVGPVLVYATSLTSISILLSAGLSFLGLGISPPIPEWGIMLNSMRQAIWVQPLNAAIPGVMIFVTSMCFNLLSDGVRRAMGVKT